MSIVKLNNRGIRSATTFGSISALGEMRFIKKQTASSSATVSFVDGTSDVVLDDTYKEYLFTFNNIHPATDGAEFQVNFSIDSGSNYNVAKNTTFVYAYHNEADGTTALEYNASNDLALGTGIQIIMENVGNDNDQCGSGYLHLYNPSDTTFTKQFIATTQTNINADYSTNAYVGGFINSTSAVDAVQFSMSSGNIDAGDICLYGIN